MAASDEFGYLKDCEQFLKHQVMKILSLLSDFNVERYQMNMMGMPFVDDARFLRFVPMSNHIDGIDLYLDV